MGTGITTLIAIITGTGPTDGMPDDRAGTGAEHRAECRITGRGWRGETQRRRGHEAEHTRAQGAAGAACVRLDCSHDHPLRQGNDCR
jgi:hypothetical protein